MIDESMYKNLECKDDNFKKTENIESILRYGDETKVNNPLVSFVIPAYSRVRELGIAIKSIIQQEELFSYELIIVDDAPDSVNDNPRLDLVRTINDDRILYYANTKNLGVEGNWNRCFKLSRGKYVSMLHDDDILSPEYMKSVKKCLETVAKHSKKFGVIQANFKIFRKNDDLPLLEINNNGELIRFCKIHCLLTGKGPVSPPSCGTIFSRLAVIELGGFNESYFPCADYLLGYFMIVRGYDCYISKDDFGWYRFGINESVKPSVIQDTIKCNYYFLRWLYKQSLFNRIWAIILGKGQISTLVDQNNKGRKIYCNFVVPKEMDSFITEYGNHRIGRFFFKVARKVVHIFSRIVYYVR